ncbi:PAS domain S-box-containing protein [Methanothermobacter defluvii]|uniref:histidine kinase n=2 Tax=Methanothermobacter TaxID=145260 RepID=A0A371NCP4_9EURY|nr:MEDS domain-containing protein [Methanothermobacter defluvii]REE28281.1 PAS domain S-box-containing protein [Methanothermobacter defluvii]BAZ99111.1 putative sensor histidine kinase pdtaS [Methanothermobacter sp. EMTCatA1]
MESEVDAMKMFLRRIRDIVEMSGQRDMESLIRDMKAGDHICIIYDDDAEWRNTLIPFMVDGLRRGERCLYICSERTADTVREELGREVPVDEFEADGRLRIMDDSDAYTDGGVFDPERMVALLESETRKAVSEGFSALRVTGEMDWVLKGLPGSERLIEYENMLNNFFPGSDCLAICQYRRSLFSPEIIRGVLLTHPLVVWNSMVYRNPYYVRPEILLRGVRSEMEVDMWLENIRRENELLCSLENLMYLYEAFIDHNPGIVFLKDSGGRYILANSSFSEVFGVDDVTGKTDPELMNRRAAEACRRSDMAALRDGESYTEEEVHGRVYGVYKFRVELPGGELGVGGFALDITDKKIHEMEVETSRNNFLGIVENSPEPMMIVDLEGVLLYSNPAARKFFDWPPGYRGKHIGIPLSRELQEVKVLTADSEVRVAEMMITDTVWEGRESLLIRLHDITRLREYEESLRRSLDEKDVMLREIHHRVKNNLQIISSLLNLQRYHLEDGRAAEALRDSVTRIKSMAMIHEKIYQTENMAHVNFREYMEDLLSELRSNYPSMDIRFQFKLEDVDLSINQAIPCGLIVNEAVTNALKHAFPGGSGEVRISMRRVGDSMEVTIADDGVGLPESFDPSVDGGLGMDLMLNLAAQLEGEVTIDGSDGVRVALRFPLEPVEEPS